MGPLNGQTTLSGVFETTRNLATVRRIYLEDEPSAQYRKFEIASNMMPELPKPQHNLTS